MHMHPNEGAFDFDNFRHVPIFTIEQLTLAVIIIKVRKALGCNVSPSEGLKAVFRHRLELSL